MEDKSTILQDLEHIASKMSPNQRQLVLMFFSIGTFTVMIVILGYMLFYMHLLNTNPCDLCYQLNDQLIFTIQ